MKKALVLLLTFVLLAIPLAGCGEDPGTVTSSTPEGAGPEVDEFVYTIAVTSEPVGFDPAVAYDPATNTVSSQVFETLLTYDEDDQLIGLLASKWETPDNTTYVYTIRDDVTFSDGTPLTIDDVLFSIQRIADPKGGALMQWMYEGVKSIEKTGDWEITVKLNEPSNSWLYVLTASGGVISKAYYEEHPEEHNAPSGAIVGTGAYVYESWASGQEIVLVKNENYWGGDLSGAPDKLVFKIIPDETTLVTALKNGEVDFTRQPPAELLDQLTSELGLNVENFPSRGVTFIALNNQRAPFDDANVRKAVYYALDLVSFQQNIIGNSGTPGTLLPQSDALYGPLPQDWEAYAKTLPTYDYNIDKATELLAASNYPDGFKINIITNESARYNDIALLVQEALRPLNIEVEILKVTSAEHDDYYWGVTRDADGHRDYDALVGSWWADFPDIGGNFEALYVGETTNVADYQNPTVTSLIAQEIAELDPAARDELAFKALDIITADVPYIFVQYPNQQVVYSKSYTGIKADTVTSTTTLRFETVRKAG